MSRRETDKDVERPHFYSQYWVTIARHYARTGSLLNLPTVVDEIEEDDFDDLPPARPVVARTVTAPPPAPVPEPETDIDDLPLPLTPRPTAKPAKPKPEPKASSLSSFADLAAIGFGKDAEMEELPVGEDDDAESVISRLGANFEDDDFPVQPDEEEAASLESLSEEEDWDEDEEEDDATGAPHRPTRPVKPPRPRRDRGF